MDREPRVTMGTKLPSFFKVLIDDYENQLRLPPAFVKNFNGNVPKKLTLRTLTRRSWTVSVKRVESNFFLCEEWRTFVKAHGLKVGELLVFRCNDNLEFCVTIFARNVCVKKIAFDGEDMIGSISYPREEHGSKKTVKTVKSHSPILQGCPEESLNNMEAATQEMTDTYNRVGSTPEKSERSKADEVLDSFTTTLVPTNRIRTTIPRSLAREKGISGKERMVLLDPSGRSWPVKIYRRQDGGIYIGNGWPSFYMKNELNIGDTCRFTFMKEVKNAMKVDILRASPNVLKEKQAGMHPCTSTEVIEPSKTAEDNSPLIETGTRGKKLESGDSRSVADQKKRRKLTTSTSNNPFFAITMRPSSMDNRYSLTLPSAFAEEHLKYAPRDVILRGSNGDTWQARYVVGANHTLAGLKAFVLDNHLQEDEVCIFELVDKNHVELKVSIIRR